MNLLQYIGNEINSLKFSTTEYKRITFTYIDKNGQKYDGLYIDIPIMYFDIQQYTAPRIKYYSQNISLYEYEDRLSKQSGLNVI